MGKKTLQPEVLASYKAEIESLLNDKDAYNTLIAEYPNYKAKLAEFRPLIDEEVKIFEERPEKRILHADIELCRIDFNGLVFNEKLESIMNKIKPYQREHPELYTLLQENQAYKYSAELYQQFDLYRHEMRIQGVGTSKFRRFLHLIAFAVYIVVVVHVCLFCSPLQLFDGILRKRGWKTYELPIDRMHRWFTSSTLYWCGVEVYWEGLENVNKEKSYVQMYSHASSYDAFCLCTGPSPIRLFGKKSLFFIPFLGWLGYVWGHIVINRNNLDSAKKSIDNAVKLLNETKRSIAISPEGTRSRNGRISDFKKGAFHFAIQAKLPISPILLMNPGAFWGGNDYTPSPGRIVVRALPEIQIQPEENYKQLRDRVHRIFLNEYKKPIGKTVPANDDFVNFLSFPFCILFTYYFYSVLGTIIGSIFA